MDYAKSCDYYYYQLSLLQIWMENVGRKEFFYYKDERKDGVIMMNYYGLPNILV